MNYKESEEKDDLILIFFTNIKKIRKFLREIENGNYTNISFKPSLGGPELLFIKSEVISFYNKELLEIEKSLLSLGINSGELRKLD